MAKHAMHCRSILCKGHFCDSCNGEREKRNAHHIYIMCVCVLCVVWVCMKPYDGQFKWSNRMEIDDFVYGFSLKRNEILYESDGQSIACTLWIHTHTLTQPYRKCKPNEQQKNGNKKKKNRIQNENENENWKADGYQWDKWVQPAKVSSTETRHSNELSD